MEKQSFLSRLKNKWLLLYLALLIPALTFTGVNQIRKAEVKGVQTVVSVVPTIIPTETSIPTSLPTPTETPTRTPTNTPQPTRVYILPTKVYIPPTQAPAAEQLTSQLDNNDYYTNSEGNTVHSPANTIDGSAPAGATARCADGTYSFSQSRRGTCSHHGGVASWL